MILSNPLDPIYRAFAVASDCFEVAQRTVDKQDEKLIRRTQFVGATRDEATTALTEAAKQASDLAILALFATFERTVIEHLQTANLLLVAGYPQEYASALAEKFVKDVEYWKVDDILDLFKGEVDANLIGQVKQIKDYRDWIAHRNPRRPTPSQATPQTAFGVPTKVIEQIRATHTRPAETQDAAVLPQEID